MTQFKISDWNETINFHVCSVFLYHKDLLYTTQIRLPKDLPDLKMKMYDSVEYAKEKLYKEAESKRKGFEPIRRGGISEIDTITFEEEDRRKQAKNKIILP